MTWYATRDNIQKRWSFVAANSEWQNDAQVHWRTVLKETQMQNNSQA